ncbi:MAG: hypothetical protein ACE5K0_04175 [Candidatus Methanofastidiosia archaeon]
MKLDRKIGRSFVIVLAIVTLISFSHIRGSDNNEFPIVTNPSDQSDPAIYDDIVVWEDDRNGWLNSDIYGYNLSIKREFQITTFPSLRREPAIYENIIVWEDLRNGNDDIYGYDLSTKREFQITTDMKDQNHPAIYENIVVWDDKRYAKPIEYNLFDYNTDIYGYDLSTEQEFQITIDPKLQRHPAVHGDIVV